MKPNVLLDHYTAMGVDSPKKDSLPFPGIVDIQFYPVWEEFLQTKAATDLVRLGNQKKVGFLLLYFGFLSLLLDKSSSPFTTVSYDFQKAQDSLLVQNILPFVKEVKKVLHRGRMLQHFSVEPRIIFRGPRPDVVCNSAEFEVKCHFILKLRNSTQLQRSEMGGLRQTRNTLKNAMTSTILLQGHTGSILSNDNFSTGQGTIETAFSKNDFVYTPVKKDALPLRFLHASKDSLVMRVNFMPTLPYFGASSGQQQVRKHLLNVLTPLLRGIN